MAEQKNSMPPRRPGGPGHGPRSHGYQRPQDLRGTVKKLLHYVGRYKGLLVLVAVSVLYSVLVCFVPETGWYSDIYPWAYQDVIETAQFWT